MRVGGTSKTIPMPSRSSQSVVSSKPVPTGETWTTLLTITGEGYCDFLWIFVTAASFSHVTELEIYCDGTLVLFNNISGFSLMGCTATTPKISLLNYGDNARCDVLFTKRFEFRSSMEVKARNVSGDQTVSADAIPNLL